MDRIEQFIDDDSGYVEEGGLNNKPETQGKNKSNEKKMKEKNKINKKIISKSKYTTKKVKSEKMINKNITDKKNETSKKQKGKKNKKSKKYLMNPNNKMNSSCASYSLINTNGSKAPLVNLNIRVRDRKVSGDNKFKWSSINTQELYEDKRIIIFALPGAFTPVCSNTHLPGYEKKYHQIKRLGIDEVYCLSVNDPFVMFQWCKNLKIKNVKPIPDGNGEFTKKMGALVNKKNLGFGIRSWRYSMVVNNGIIEKIFAEKGKKNNCPADPFEVSDVETMLKYLKSV